MSVKDRISSQLDHFSESELEEIARYVSFLKFRSKVQKTEIPCQEKMAALYGLAADEDAELAEVSISDYARDLAAEDTQ